MEAIPDILAVAPSARVDAVTARRDRAKRFGWDRVGDAYRSFIADLVA